MSVVKKHKHACMTWCIQARHSQTINTKCWNKHGCMDWCGEVSYSIIKIRRLSIPLLLLCTCIVVVNAVLGAWWHNNSVCIIMRSNETISLPKGIKHLDTHLDAPTYAHTCTPCTYKQTPLSILAWLHVVDSITTVTSRNDKGHQQCIMQNWLLGMNSELK